MFGISDSKRRDLNNLGYAAAELKNKSIKAVKEGDPDKMTERILKNQIFILKVISEKLIDL